MKFEELQIDALREFVNIGIGTAAATLNEMLSSHIHLEAPSVILLEPESSVGLDEWMNKQLSCVQLGYDGAITGKSILVFPLNSAEKLVAALTDEIPGTVGMNAAKAGTLNEIGNIVINAVMGAISNILGTRLEYSLPYYTEGTLEQIIDLKKCEKKSVVLFVDTKFAINDLQIDGNIFYIFELNSCANLLNAIDQFYQE